MPPQQPTVPNSKSLVEANPATCTSSMDMPQHPFSIHIPASPTPIPTPEASYPTSYLQFHVPQIPGAAVKTPAKRKTMEDVEGSLGRRICFTSCFPASDRDLNDEEGLSCTLGGIKHEYYRLDVYIVLIAQHRSFNYSRGLHVMLKISYGKS